MPRPSFNIRSFGSNCSAINRVVDRWLVPVFQYPLFRIELLSWSPPQQTQRCRHVSISALSDRIAQPLGSPCRSPYAQVSISALSDRIAQHLRPGAKTLIDDLFQYPLFRIELLSSAKAKANPTSSPSFNIRSFGSNCSALQQNLGIVPA